MHSNPKRCLDLYHYRHYLHHHGCSGNSLSHSPLRPYLLPRWAIFHHVPRLAVVEVTIVVSEKTSTESMEAYICFLPLRTRPSLSALLLPFQIYTLALAWIMLHIKIIRISKLYKRTMYLLYIIPFLSGERVFRLRFVQFVLGFSVTFGTMIDCIP
jgi:hypothetical protein